MEEIYLAKVRAALQDITASTSENNNQINRNDFYMNDTQLDVTHEELIETCKDALSKFCNYESHYTQSK